MLRFLGRGSAFHTQNNCAFFTQGKRLVLLDCPVSALNRLRHIGFNELAGTEIDGITILVTHTHLDHTGGIGLLIHYCCYVKHIPVELIAPSEEVKEDLFLLTNRFDGCRKDCYTLITAEEAGYDWIKAAIPTVHAPELEGRCFGWCLDVGGEKIVYTGDSSTLDPFMPYLTEGTTLYTEVSAFDSVVHISMEKLESCMDELKRRKVRVFLMHIDDEGEIGALAERTGAELAPLY